MSFSRTLSPEVSVFMFSQASFTEHPFTALEKWSLGPADLHPHNPSLIFTRVSGYGQTGPWAPRPGYASVCEAESGFRYINGFPDLETQGLSGPPVRPNISLGDSIAGLHAAFGTVRYPWFCYIYFLLTNIKGPSLAWEAKVNNE